MSSRIHFCFATRTISSWSLASISGANFLTRPAIPTFLRTISPIIALGVGLDLCRQLQVTAEGTFSIPEPALSEAEGLASKSGARTWATRQHSVAVAAHLLSSVRSSL